MNVSERCNVVCCVECERVCVKERLVASCGRRKHHVCIIYLHKMGDMRSSKAINCLNADSFSGHESWEGGCPQSWSAREPWGLGALGSSRLAWEGRTAALARASCSPRWLSYRSNALWWDVQRACLACGFGLRGDAPGHSLVWRPGRLG